MAVHERPTTMTPFRALSAPGEAPPEAGVSFMMELATALHRYGTPAHRLEATMGAVADRLGFQAQFLTTPTFILAGFGPPSRQQMSMVRIEPGSVNLEKLTRLNHVVERVGRGEISAEQGADKVRAIMKLGNRYSPALRVLGSGMLSASSACFFGGDWQDIAASVVIGFWVGLLSLAFVRTIAGSRVFELLAAFCAAFIAHAWNGMISPVSVRVVTLAGVIMLLPGLMMTVAMTEIASKHLVSGTARLMAAAIVFLEIIFGVGLAERIAAYLWGPLGAVQTGHMPSWIQLCALPFSIAALMINSKAHPRALVVVACAATAALGSSRLGAHWLGPELGAAMGSFVLAAGANIFATRRAQPAMLALLPGLIMLVPGAMGVRSLASFLQGEVVTGLDTAFAMALVAVSLVAGLLIANAAFPPRRGL